MDKLSTLIDNFNDNSTDPALWQDFLGGGASSDISETNGRCVIKGTTHSPQRLSTQDYDLSDSQITLKVPVVTPAGISGTLQSGIIVGFDNSNSFIIRKLGNNIECIKNIAGTQTVVYTAIYSSTAHLWWRIRESAGIVFWETAAEGVYFTSLFSISTPFDVSDIFTSFFTAYSGVEVSPGTIEFETVNPVLLTDVAGNAALPFTNSAVTNLTPNVLTFSASGAALSSGTAAAFIQFSATGTSTTNGNAFFTIVSTSGNVAASGSSLSFGTASVSVPTWLISSAGVAFSSGAAALLQNNQISADGFLTSTGQASLSRVTGTWLFEPPVVNDNPTTLPPPFPQIRNSFARWQQGQPRGRTVLKLTATRTVHTGTTPDTDIFPEDAIFPDDIADIIIGVDTYIVVDSPTIDQLNAAIIAYQGGHIYTIGQTEAFSLIAAGFHVTPVGDSGSGFLFPAQTILPSPTLFSVAS